MHQILCIIYLPKQSAIQMPKPAAAYSRPVPRTQQDRALDALCNARCAVDRSSTRVRGETSSRRPAHLYDTAAWLW